MKQGGGSLSSALQVPPITIEQYKEFQGYPGLRDELIHGRIVMSPRPKPLHQQVGKNVVRLLDLAPEGQAYTAQQNSNLKFTGLNSMPAPDVFVTSKDLWNRACLENRT